MVLQLSRQVLVKLQKAVGEIAADSFKKTGDILDTNAIKLQQVAAGWENV